MKNTWSTNEQRWQAIVNKNTEANEHFVYGVKSSLRYYTINSTSRIPNKDNIEFFSSAEHALAAGYKANKKLLKQENGLDPKLINKIEKACRLIEQQSNPLTLELIAQAVGISPFHFHRTFKAIVGLTPKAYADAQRQHKLQEQLETKERITDAILESGFNSSSRFYENAHALLGMDAKQWKQGGKDSHIYFALGLCNLGHILVAQSSKGICAILLGDDPQALLEDLENKFPRAQLNGGDTAFEQTVAQVIGFIENRSPSLNIALDIQGSAFQQKVWLALKDIPLGQTMTYSEIAQKIGSPKAVRAVANACAANMLAVAIPCHRVIRQDGSLSGYRWGIERKKRLLKQEQET